MYQSKDQFTPAGSHTVASAGVSFKVNVGEILKILERVFDCRIKIQFSKEDISNENQKNEEGKQIEGTVTTTETSIAAPAPKQIFTVVYNKSVYKAFWWNWLPGSIFEKLYKNLELLAFKNSVSTVEMPDTILSTWGAIEQYYFELKPILIHAYNFICRACGGTTNNSSETNMISSKLFCFMLSSIVRGKSVLPMDTNMQIGQEPIDAPVLTTQQKNLNKADPLIQEIFKDDVITLAPSVWSKLVTMESRNVLNPDSFVECILAMGNESFNKLHLLIDHHIENNTIGSSTSVPAMELERILLRDGKLILDYIRTFMLGISKMSSITPTSSRPTSKESSMRNDSSSKNGALRKSMLVGRASMTNKARNSMKNPSRSSFMLSVQLKQNRPSQMIQNAAGEKPTPSWAALAPTQETVEEGEEEEEEEDDDDSDSDSNGSNDSNENDEKDNEFEEEEDVEVKKNTQAGSSVRWDDQNQYSENALNNIPKSGVAINGMEIFIHHAELYFDPELRAVQGIQPCLYDLYFTYLALRRLLYSLYITGSSGDLCIAQLEKNHVAINHYRYQLIRKVFIRWSLVEK